MLHELAFFILPAVYEEARQRMASQTRASSLMEVLGDRWVKLRGEHHSAAANTVTSKTAARDDQPTRLFMVLYEQHHWFVESSVLMGLHPDLHTSATPEGLTAMFDHWARYKLARKRRSDALRSLVVSAYDNLYSAATHLLGGQPAPLLDAEVYFDPAVPHYSPINLSWIPSCSDWVQCAHDGVGFEVFAPHCIDPHFVEDAIEADIDLAEPAPPRIAANASPRANHDGSHIFMGTGLDELGHDSDGESQDADSADDGLGSPNTRGASQNTSLFGTLSPESPHSQHDESSNSVAAPVALLSSAPAFIPLGSSLKDLLVDVATVASPVVVPQSKVLAPSQLQLAPSSSNSRSPPSPQPDSPSSPLLGSASPSF
ncbi:hypothetical protein PC120_g3405 [Phytophthora cactorum]|nr:hypothetical protein PC120_g3405 [Phytophthora cactorum]